MNPHYTAVQIISGKIKNRNSESGTQIAVPEQTPQPAFRTVNSGSYNYLTENS